MGLFHILYFHVGYKSRLGCKLNAEYQQIKNGDSQREIVIVIASSSIKGIYTLTKYECR